MISNCGKDERGKYSGGVAGDQTGREYEIRSWYNRPWDCVLRYPTLKVGEMIGSIATRAANNSYIGYDQGERLSMYNAMATVGWDVDRIRKPVEADCSSSTMAVIIAAGYKLGIKALQRLQPSLVTWNMEQPLMAAGFLRFTEKKFLDSDRYLLPGDILLNRKSHVAINVTYGVDAVSVAKPAEPDIKNPSTYPVVRFGNQGQWVVVLQNALINWGYSCGPKGADGDFGSNTLAAVRKFQVDHRLVVDGAVGAKTWEALFPALTGK